MQRVEYDLKLVKHKDGSLSGRIVSDQRKRASCFKIPSKHYNNHKYIANTLKMAMLKVEK
jgi:hypothetical protein